MLNSDVELKLIPDIVDTYMAGSDGEIYSKRGNFWKPLKKSKSASSTGYFQVSVVNKDGRRLSKLVHVLVCQAFNGDKPFGRATVSHIDGDKYNNIPTNLEWLTYYENLRMKRLHGTHDCGSANSRASLSYDELFIIRWLLENTKMTHVEISEMMGVSRLTITKIANKYRYAAIIVKVVGEVTFEENKLDRLHRNEFIIVGE